jgi:hypothetical protein
MTWCLRQTVTFDSDENGYSTLHRVNNCACICLTYKFVICVGDQGETSLADVDHFISLRQAYIWICMQPGEYGEGCEALQGYVHNLGQSCIL